jgi:hypothetical protein
MNEPSRSKTGAHSSARHEPLPKSRIARALLALVIAPLLACSSKHEPAPAKGAEPIPECEEYASRYETCLSAAGSKEVAHRRAQATRDAFAAAVHEGKELAELRQTCAAGLARLNCR